MNQIETKPLYALRVMKVDKTMTKNFSERLKAILKSENAAKLPINQVSLIWELLRRLDDELVKFMVHFEERQDIFSIEISGQQASSWLQALSPALRINSTEADFMLMQHARALLFEINEAFLCNFVDSLDFDGDSNVKGSLGPFLIHYLIMTYEPVMLRLLLDRNVNVEQEYNGSTPFQWAAFCQDEEMVAMFIYYNISPSFSVIGEILNGELIRESPFLLAAELAAENHNKSNISEMLFAYTYDQHSDFDFDIFVKMMQIGSPHFADMARLLRKHMHSLVINFDRSSSILIWENLFEMEKYPLNEIFHFFRKKDNLIEDLIDCFSIEHWEMYWQKMEIRRGSRPMMFINKLFRLASWSAYKRPGVAKPRPSFLQMMMDKIRDDLPLRVVVETFHRFKRGNRTGPCLRRLQYKMESTILLLLSQGALMDSFTFDMIFDMSCRNQTDLFEVCRLLEVDCSKTMPAYYLRNYGAGFVVSSFYHQFPHGKTIMEVLRNPDDVRAIDLDFYTGMSSHPAVKAKAQRINDPYWTAIIDRLPKCPTLLEFARDVARNYVVERYEVKTSWQFTSAVEKLEIPKKLQKIILYDLDMPLYQ